MRSDIDEVLQYWFGELKEGFPGTDRSALWWKGEPSQDREIKELFGKRVSQALRGELKAWELTPRGQLAVILLLDQFTRMIFRGTALAFQGDKEALRITKEALQGGHHLALEFAERLFLYMPLEHDENLQSQELCVGYIEEMLHEVPLHQRHQVDVALDFAMQHKDLIVQFGRFPHRNRVLERESTALELVYLNQLHSHWGQ
jgi:uncharacterized protein (DUF924 family)